MSARTVRALLVLLVLTLATTQQDWESRVQVTHSALTGPLLCLVCLGPAAHNRRRICGVFGKAGRNHPAPSLPASQGKGAPSNYRAYVARTCCCASPCAAQATSDVTRQLRHTCVVSGGNCGGSKRNARAPARYRPLAHGRGSEGGECESGHVWLCGAPRRAT